MRLLPGGKCTKKEIKEGCKVFVYGSLKSGQGNNNLLDSIGGVCLGYDSITGPFQMMTFGYFPGVVRRSDDAACTTIKGEIWLIDPLKLKNIDFLESHPRFYERFKFVSDILDLRAWMYILPADNGYLKDYDQVEDNIWHQSPEELEYWAQNN